MTPAAVKQTVESAVEATKVKAVQVKETVTEVVVEKTTETVTKVLKTANDTRSRLNILPGLFNAQRRMVLAGIGAVSLATESLGQLSDRCIERGEEVEKQARQFTATKIEEAKKLLPKLPLTGKTQAEETAEEVKVEAAATETVETPNEVKDDTAAKPEIKEEVKTVAKVAKASKKAKKSK